MNVLGNGAMDSSSTRPATLEDVPAEIANEIMSYLRPHDLTQLAQTSKTCGYFSQSALWRNIELHRRDAHEGCFSFTSATAVSREYLDDELRSPWSYRIGEGFDIDFAYRNANFNRVIRELYRTSSPSPEWMRLAHHVRHVCLTVTHNSPRRVWNMVLSLPNLSTVELIGEYSNDNRGPPKPCSLQVPASNKIRSVRLRGYIPVEFVSTLCKASASSITSLDLGILEPPQMFDRDLEDLEHHGFPNQQPFVAPRGVLWYWGNSGPLLNSLTHLSLCKRGPFRIALDFYGEEYYETRDDNAHELDDFKQWATLLRSVRSTIVEVILEQRPVYLDHVLVYNDDLEVFPHDSTDGEMLDMKVFDSLFYKHILTGVFDSNDDNGLSWPNLQKLTFRGIHFPHFDQIASEPWFAFTQRVLPGVQVQLVPGNYMFFSMKKGIIQNQTWSRWT